MAGLLRNLASVSRASGPGAALNQALRSMASGAAPSKNDIVHLLDNREDPDVDAAVREYMKAAYANPKAAPEKPEETPELTAKVQRKYVAALVVESGVQNISVPLGWNKSDSAPLKRYTQQLLQLGYKAGFEDPINEVAKTLREKSAGAETAKELLASIKPYASPAFHAQLVEALAAVEAETNSVVTLDGASAGYKKFAERVKKVAEANGLPAQLLVDVKKPAADEEARSKVALQYSAFCHAARAADMAAEIEVMRAEATALLDRHLGKSAETIRKEQAAALATLQRKIDAAKGAPWAVQYAKDLEALAAYDAAVAADPVNGPKVAVA